MIKKTVISISILLSINIFLSFKIYATAAPITDTIAPTTTTAPTTDTNNNSTGIIDNTSIVGSSSSSSGNSTTGNFTSSSSGCTLDSDCSNGQVCIFGTCQISSSSSSSGYTITGDSINISEKNKCTEGLDLIVQAEDNPPESILTPENIANGTVSVQEISGCPFTSSQTIPENVTRTTVIHTAGCAEPCPKYADLNGESLNVTELIQSYYQGGDSSQLCELLKMNPTVLDNCLITNYYDEEITEQATTFLNSEERDRLNFKWSKWRDRMIAPMGESRSTGVTIYASSKQNQASIFMAVPLRLSWQERIGPNNWREVTYDVSNDVINKFMLMLDPTIALQDLQRGNVFPDYNNDEGRRMSGSLRYRWQYIVGGMVIADYSPYYHASFNGYYTAGLAHKCTLVANNSLDLAHNTLASEVEWNSFRRKYQDGALSNQTPIKSPWNPNPGFTVLDAMTIANFARYALLIAPSQGNSRDLYSFNADVNLIKYLLVTYYGVQAADILTAGTKDAITNLVSVIQGRARTAKTSGKTTQLVVYIVGHSASPLENEAIVMGSPAILGIESKEGGKSLEVPLTENSTLYEFSLKNNLGLDLQDEGDPQNNVIDNAFIIIETCNAGAGVI